MTNDVVRKLMQIHDEASGDWMNAFAVPGIDGKQVIVEVPLEERTLATVRRSLLRKGAASSAIDDIDLAAAIKSDAPVVYRAARTGWRDGNRTFVSLCFVASHAPEGTVIPPRNQFASRSDQVQVCGTLEGWQERIKVARYSTAMTTALCAAFAAPLMSLTHTPNFGIVLTGPSRSGKSSAQLMAASVMGYGQELDLPDHNATSSGMLAAALAFNGHLMPLNEIATARGGKKEAYGAIRDLTYTLGNGRDVTRHPSWTGGGETGTFQILPLLSSELSPDAWAARNGEARDPGETARLINLPAVMPGQTSVFDRAPENLQGEALTAWESEQFRLLRENLPHHRGHGFKRYVEYLIEDIADSTAYAQEQIAYFERKLVTPSMTAIHRDIVRKFGLLFAAGVLAIDSGVLPLNDKEMARTISDACRDALADLPDPEKELRSDAGAFKKRLSSGSIIDLDNAGTRRKGMLEYADGYYRRDDGGVQVVVRATVFVEMLSSSVRARRLLEKFDEEGLLEHSRPHSQGSSTEWAQKQVTWPDKRRVRSICLYLPGGLNDLKRYV